MQKLYFSVILSPKRSVGIIGPARIYMWIGNIEDYILYEDKELIVCHKPAGIAVQNARVGTMDLESALKNYLAVKKAKNEVIAGTAVNTGTVVPYLGIVHRLDQPVEGVLVFAKTPGSARELSRQMSANEMGKIYLAVTAGKPQAAQGNLEDYLKKDGRTNTSAVVNPGTPGAKQARLRYKVLAETRVQVQENGVEAVGRRQESVTETTQAQFLLWIELETGRHHQIRVQMANAGMPLLGDQKYNPGANAGVALALCSCRLSFRHPHTKKKMEFFVTPQGKAFDVFQEELRELKE